MSDTNQRPYFPFQDHDLLAALVFLRFNREHDQARAAWTRMLQNNGWDDRADARQEWLRMVDRGLKNLKSVGLVETS